ncbi:hypothetical protein V8E36_007384 [Tilletia maclaganii]
MNHLAFNVRPPTTAWLNMGWWESENVHFVDAAEELASRLHSAVEMPPHPNILDVGCGSGDSLLLLQRTRSPAVLHGVTSLSSHATFARKRLRSQAQIHKDEDESHNVICSDVIPWIKQRPSSSSAHMLSLGPNPTGYDAIFALDCAYHFNDRLTFLQHAFQILRPGGSVALVDLALAWPYPPSSPNFTPSQILPAPTRPPTQYEQLKHKVSSAAASTPAKNFVPIDTYIAHLCQAGFAQDEISIEDISAQVLRGFARFLSGVGQGEDNAWRARPNVLLRFGLNSVGKHVVSQWAAGGDSGMLRCVLVSARKAS